MSDHSDYSSRFNDRLTGDAFGSVDVQTPIPSDECSFVTRLLDSEPRHTPRPEYIHLCRNRASLLTSRQDSVNSILQVHAHFGFKPVTAFLSINYMDRFLSSRALPETRWAFQLLLMACLSLAAKMEESYVPLLLELQILEPTYVFEPGTIQRMEILVFATLKWNLRSVTPFDYLYYLISILPSSASNSDSVSTIYDHASSIILNTTRVVDFLGFLPSVIAAAAVITAVGDYVDLHLPDTLDARISREMVKSCHRLMDEYLLDTCPSKALRIEPLAPPSPLGVLDAAACASCDTLTEHQALVLGSDSGSIGDEVERENKRPRISTPGVQ
ncbi:hypothetical protein OROGR_009760 [Orobanche gracilis]